jgi:hypothetical protein
MANCRSCGAKISWIVTKSGKKNPVDHDYKTIVTDEGEVVRGRESHFATCPDAEKWRGTKHHDAATCKIVGCQKC